jgi:hypothetical protein
MSGPAGSEEPAAAAGSGIVVVMPAYNAALTLERTYADIPHPLVERIILVDDVWATSSWSKTKSSELSQRQNARRTGFRSSVNEGLAAVHQYERDPVPPVGRAGSSPLSSCPMAAARRQHGRRRGKGKGESRTRSSQAGH